jgi:hypothetical protein
MNITFECIWKKNAEAERQQVISLWKRFNTFSDAEVTAQRATEIVFIAKRNNEVVGVTTVRPLQVKLLNNNYFHEFRIFISPEERIPALDTLLTIKTKEFFEQHPDVSDFPSVGIVAVIENEDMKQKWNRAVWPGIDLVFAGYTPKGDHIRVSYFKGARI